MYHIVFLSAHVIFAVVNFLKYSEVSVLRYQNVFFVRHLAPRLRAANFTW